MTFKKNKFKASTLCAGGTLMVLGGFMSINLAGCGGGGGNGGGIIRATPVAISTTFRLIDIDNNPVSGGTVRLTRLSTNRALPAATSNGSGDVVIPNVTPGRYNVSYTINGTTTTREITITGDASQVYLLVEGDNGQGDFRISGTLFLNPPGDDDDADPSNDTAIARCSTDPVPLTADITIVVRDQNSGAILATLRRLENTTGFYSISLATRPQSFRVEVRQASGDSGNFDGATFAGNSSLATFPPNATQINGLDICANEGNIAPRPGGGVTPVPTAFATATPRPGQTVFPTTAPRPTATLPGPTPTAVPGATATAVPGATATVSPFATFTPVPTVAPGATPTAVPTLSPPLG